MEEIESSCSAGTEAGELPTNSWEAWPDASASVGVVRSCSWHAACSVKRENVEELTPDITYETPPVGVTFV